MAIDTKSLTQIITEFRALQTKDAVLPESLGYILQRIVDLLSTAGTSETVTGIQKLLDGFKAAGQAITALSQGQSDRNHIYANKSTVNLATGAVTSTSGIFIQQATTERAGAMRAQQVIDLNATKKAVAEVEKILEIVQVKLGMTEGSKTLFNTAQIAVIDSIVRNIDFSFDTLKINIERPVQYAEASEIIRLTATKGRVIDRRRVYRDSVEAFNQLDTVAYKKSAAEASTEHTATTRLYNPPDGTAVAVVALIIAGVLIYLFLRKK